MTNKSNIKMVDGDYEKADFNDEEDSSSDIDPENIDEEDDSDDAEELKSQNPPVKTVASIMNKLLTAEDDGNSGILSQAKVKREASSEADKGYDDGKAMKELKKIKLEKQREKRELLDMSRVNPKANTDRERERTLRIIATQEKEAHLKLAEIAEEAERYEDMKAAMKQVTETGLDLSSEEKELLFMAYRTIINSRRGSWRRIFVIEKIFSFQDRKRQWTNDYRMKIQTEIIQLCQEIVGLLDKIIIPQDCNLEGKIYNLQTRGDFYRYQAEVLSKSKQTGVLEEASKSYKEAYNIAKENMQPAHPTRMGVAVNFSLFCAITLEEKEQGLQLAREANDAAIYDLHNLPRNLIERALATFQILSNNIIVWAS